MDPAHAVEWEQRVRAAVAHAVVGLERELRACLVAVVAEGHVLLEGPPGVAKTLLVRSLGAALGRRYARVQFTPDLMPADVTGTSVFRPAEGRFEFHPGPLFTELLLCDEINRAPAKTQAALLEAMQERAVTVDGTTHALPETFVVFATQNPIEHEGTYPLPEAQLDRFLLKVLVRYPSAEVEARLFAEAHARPPAASPAELGVARATDGDELARVVAAARAVEVRAELCEYASRLVRATREDRALVLGASPRAGVALLRAAKALALLSGRDYATPDDLKAVAPPVLRHRIALDPAEELAGTTADGVLERVLDTVEVPR